MCWNWTAVWPYSPVTRFGKLFWLFFTTKHTKNAKKARGIFFIFLVVFAGFVVKFKFWEVIEWPNKNI
jgi:hypothetical protein